MGWDGLGGENGKGVEGGNLLRIANRWGRRADERRLEEGAELVQGGGKVRWRVSGGLVVANQCGMRVTKLVKREA